MQDLTLVGVHDDGEHLVLSGPGGERYRLAVDEPLRAAVRRDRARLAQLQLEHSTALRPRDIQARIRAGHSSDDVADEAGVPVEHVRRYEGPVLAEREFVARQARGVRVRHAARPEPGAPGASPTLDELVVERLAAREVDPSATIWDAWRTDGTWVVRLSFTAGGRERHADWAYDGQLRHVSPLDDEARWFLDEPAAPERAQGRRALAPVREGIAAHERVYDVEADGGVQAADDGRAGAAAATVDLLDTLRERRGRRQWLPDPGDDEPETPDELEAAVDQLRVRAEALGDPPPAHPARSSAQDLADAEVLALPEAPVAAPPPQGVRSARPARGAEPQRAQGGARGGGRGGADRRPTPASSASRPAPPPPAPPVPAPTVSAPPARVPSGSAPARPAANGSAGGSRQSPGPATSGQGVTGPGATSPAGGAAPDALDLDAAADHDRGASRRARRASVPSWDDIVFGSRRE